MYIYIWLYVYIYIYIYLYLFFFAFIFIYAIIWAKFGPFRGYYRGQVGVIIWAKVFLANRYSGFGHFWTLNYHFVFFVAQLPAKYVKIVVFPPKWCPNTSF